MKSLMERIFIYSNNRFIDSDVVLRFMFGFIVFAVQLFLTFRLFESLLLNALLICSHNIFVCDSVFLSKFLISIGQLRITSKWRQPLVIVKSQVNRVKFWLCVGKRYRSSKLRIKRNKNTAKRNRNYLQFIPKQCIFKW